MQDLFIIGSGPFARDVFAFVDDINAAQPRFAVVAFVDALAKPAVDMATAKLPVLAEDEVLARLDGGFAVALGIADPGVSSAVMRKFVGLPVDFPNLVHPSFLGRHTEITMGRGTVIASGVVFTRAINVGEFNIFNVHSTIGHDCRIGDLNVFNPGCNISGNVTIGSRNLVGANATVLQGLTVGDDCIVGAGSVVTEDLRSGFVYLGSPARPVRETRRNG